MKRRRIAAVKILRAAAAYVVALIFVFPFVWMVMTSLKTRVDVIDPSVWVFRPTLENYWRVLHYRNLLHYLTNTVVIALSTTVVSLVLGTMAAYGLTRFQFRGRRDLALWILSLRMLPPMSTVIPLFLLARYAGLLDTRTLLIIVYMTFNVPFTVWMMRGFFLDIPIELEEAAMVDGASRLTAFTRILLPLVAPGLAATAIFCILQSWNEFALALFLTTVRARTMPTMVTLFLSVQGVVWGEMAAVGVVATAPMVIFALLVQKYLVRGLTLGAVRG